ncbi:CocE/NonD family hydrolase [Actinomadura kijaniata]|uniref:CocE/NonD family hydrolase n=1 Tax=Actinomadura kijaniata TaxID=46161 RepID=UPI00082C40E5|nr:CocE/NonD family hydrolase [Actinomadura kijaniata]
MAIRTTSRAPTSRPRRTARVARRLLRGLPPARHTVGCERDLPVPAADGVTLLTDHYFPAEEGEFPTLLVRSPYGRAFPWAALYGMAFAEQGFHVVLQSCRGTGGSGGEFTPWRDEASDGHATVAWLREQPWFSGAFGTVGASYLGYTQWALAQDPPPELRAMVIQMGVHDPYGFYYAGGAFNAESALISASGMLHQGRGALPFLRGALRLRRHLGRAVAADPLIDAYVPALGERVPFLEDALTRPDADDPHWRGADLGEVAARLTVPTCLIAGWDDVFLDQNLRQHARLRGSVPEWELVVGPWTHTSAFGEGLAEVFGHSLAWLRGHLCGEPPEVPRTPVRVHVGGADEWRGLPDWPPGSTERRWYVNADGALGEEPDTSPPVSFRYDPADPPPATGGPLLSGKAGRRDNTALEERADVLTFTTAPLAEPVTVMGRVAAELRVAVPDGHGDVFARLCDVDERGRSRNVCDGLLRLPSATPRDTPVAVTVPMSSTAYRFAAGHRVRLQISGGAHPRFARAPEPFELALHPPSALVLPQLAS